MVRVMVVDDDPSVCYSLTAFLEDWGLEVEPFGSGEEALDWLKSGYVHVAVVDLRLPGISGDRLIPKIREIHPNLPCIIYTGSTDFTPSSVTSKLDNVPVYRKPMSDLSILVEHIMALAKGR